MKQKRLWCAVLAGAVAMGSLLSCTYAEEASTEEPEQEPVQILVTENWVPSEDQLEGRTVLAVTEVGTSRAVLLSGEGDLTLAPEGRAEKNCLPRNRTLKTHKKANYAVYEPGDLELLEGSEELWYLIPCESGTAVLPAGAVETDEKEDPEEEEPKDTAESGTELPRQVYPGEAAADLAKTLLGVPYVWAGASPYGFDCSGFTMYVYGKLGISFAHSCNKQLELGEEITVEELQPGDLIFFEGTYITIGASHVGIYLGDGTYAHASSSNGGISISEVGTDYFYRHLLSVRRYY